MLFLDRVCTKHRKLINLDLLYLKIYKCSVAEFWICCVLLMPKFCTKNCRKLLSKSFYMIYFVFMQNLSK
jgi:hypothetical protein